MACLFVCVCTCKQCQENEGSRAPWPSLQHRKQPWVQEMTPPSEGGRKAEDKHEWSHGQISQMTTKFNGETVYKQPTSLLLTAGLKMTCGVSKAKLCA